MPSEEEKQAAIDALKTADERAALELDKPRRGRPPGSTNAPKSKMSEETLEAGCVSFVKLCWLLSKGGTRVFGGTLADLSDAELLEGAKEARNLVNRFAFLVTLLMVIGFPVWMFGKLITHIKRREKSVAALSIVENEKQISP